ncbi:hypothetical protein P154DRAFT_562182 [Amniculicola lignicola CBS 123094]|uniref:S-adenosyl-L-methionine-dependent methyltransferase n=1 Tax=Amniculicola lignicola CBS 123094 TaxID=1392246 RepID=A0A6A5WK53_9PLEO|nr:hypothetical protein P154DRAFT_562182 [Amniculicola lignicola CBS 123094]
MDQVGHFAILPSIISLSSHKISFLLSPLVYLGASSASASHPYSHFSLCAHIDRPHSMSLSPSSTLPSVRSLFTATDDQINSALRTIQYIYCPLRLPLVVSSKRKFARNIASGTATPIPVDSGYASGDDDGADSDAEDALATVRADIYERNFTVRWLTSLVGRAEEIAFESEESRARTIEDAVQILASFSNSSEVDVDQALTRDFSFPLSTTDGPRLCKTIGVKLNDAPLSDTDHTGVGLQSWGASIVLSSLICSSPSRFGLASLSTNQSIIELGAGTGLVSLTLAKIFPLLSQSAHHSIPRVLATDYHPAVLENLQANITANFSSSSPLPITTMLLDWASPPLLSSPADMLIAADVVYAPEHASLLRDCAARLLSPDGVFWLIVTVRDTGKFEGIPNTVEEAFAEENGVKKGGLRLKILGKERVEKRKGVGRGDERGYDLYRIKWT